MTFSLARLLAALVALEYVALAQPNVVFILTDNQGAWTLPSYGNKDIRTPSIDGLAEGGIRFARAYANNPVCSPNRATLLTGLMPSQHGVHSFLSAGLPQIGEGSYCTIREFASLPKILKSKGYACGLVGKWHLGDNLHPQEGFDDYWITMPHGNTRRFFNAEVIENQSVRLEPDHLTRLWTRHALRFIEQNRKRPFFLFLTYNGPYGLGPAQLEDAERAPHFTDYARAELPSFPRVEPHAWLFNNREYINNPTCIRRYAAEVTTIDDGVGEIMAKLKALDLERNTLIVFTADNGWAGGQHGVWGMGDHTRPLSAFETTMRVPLIFRQTGRIPAGRVGNLMVSHRDFLPSLLDYLGLGQALPAQQLTGRSYASILLGGKEPKGWENAIYYEYEILRSIRTETMKWIERLGDGVDELYDLANDPEERRNLAGDPIFAARRSQLKKKTDEFFQAHASPEFDLWKGGRSKARRIQ